MTLCSTNDYSFSGLFGYMGKSNHQSQEFQNCCIVGQLSSLSQYCLLLFTVNGNSGGVHRVGGGGGGLVDRSDLNSCSSSTDSHDTVDEEKRLVYEILSQLQPPQVAPPHALIRIDYQSLKAQIKLTLLALRGHE